VEFRILGPIEVEDDLGTPSLEAPKQRALLGVLLLHPNQVVSTDRLIDELWGERPPATAGKLVQTYVSQLRRLLGSDAIVTRAPGYLLRVDDDALDAARFHRLIETSRGFAASGQHAPAVDLYRKALALWRGPPLADVVFESYSRNEAEQLEEERLAALMERIDCDLALERHEELLAELQALVRQYPHRERLRAQLMLALYRSGRQVEALAAYQDARRVLVDELGIEPGHQLHELERAILRHDRALEAPLATVTDPAIPTEVTPAELRARSKVRVGRSLAAGVLVALALALVLAFELRGGGTASRVLAPNSVGFIDAASGRMTRYFPVGRAPIALVVADDSLWVASYRDESVMRLDRGTGRSLANVPIAGLHPTSLIASGGEVWVWTLEGSLVRIDPRFNTAGDPIPLAAGATAGASRGFRAGEPGAGGSITASGRYLWMTAPGTTVIWVDPTNTKRRLLIVPDDGAEGPIASRDGEVWVGGTSRVFPIDADTRIPGAGIDVGAIYDLAFGADTLWVVSGGPLHVGADQALRRLDLRNRIVDGKVKVGNNPIRVAAAAGSIWVASRTDATVYRVDPHDDPPRVTKTIPVGSTPSALTADRGGVWVAVD
jgi:DNA-binding SARP family transcriptional activator/streptogramin lyase